MQSYIEYSDELLIKFILLLRHDYDIYSFINETFQAHLRVEDTDPDPADCDNLGRYLSRTRLLVEVLEVDPSDEYIRVGAKGVAIPSHFKDKVVLGKAKVSDRPPVVE